MSKKNEVLAKVEEIARRHGAGYLADEIKSEFAAIWGEDEAAAPAEPTDTFNVLVGVEVKRWVGAYQSAVERVIEETLTSAASSRDEVVSLSVTGA